MLKVFVQYHLLICGLSLFYTVEQKQNFQIKRQFGLTMDYFVNWKIVI